MDKINAEVFLKVAETGSFRSAADMLGYTQAGISYIISSMEKETGLSLFLREHSGVSLTREGEELLPYMKQLKVWERQFQQTVDELNGLERGTLRVQIFDSISIHWIPGIVRRFHDDYPGVKIELISEEDSARQEQMVQSGEVDCGFFLTTVKSDIDYYPLLEENLLAIVAEDHPLAALDRFPIKELGKHPFISMKYDDHTGIGAIFKKRKVKPKTAFQMDNDYAAMGMVSKGLGFCIFPELLLTDMPEGLKCMEFDEPQKRTISIGTASIQNASGACRKFIEYTKEWVQEYIKGADPF
ncbi:DNA-binding transcriptional regulator, LysR family [Lachnospiraceae bacterium]|nr:DNA-binding transcriptional regulator, LysR family [Lachnospiraceae bacterium]